MPKEKEEKNEKVVDYQLSCCSGFRFSLFAVQKMQATSLIDYHGSNEAFTLLHEYLMRSFNDRDIVKRRK